MGNIAVLHGQRTAVGEQHHVRALSPSSGPIIPRAVRGCSCPHASTVLQRVHIQDFEGPSLRGQTLEEHVGVSRSTRSFHRDVKHRSQLSRAGCQKNNDPALHQIRDAVCKLTTDELPVLQQTPEKRFPLEGLAGDHFRRAIELKQEKELPRSVANPKELTGNEFVRIASPFVEEGYDS